MGLDAGNVDAKLYYCKALIEQGHVAKALPMLLNLKQLRPHDPTILMGLYTVYHCIGHYEQARTFLLDILAIEPKHMEAREKLSTLSLEGGPPKQAEAEARTTLTINPYSAMAYYVITQAKRIDDPNDPDIAAIQALYDKGRDGPILRARSCFMLGKIMEDLKNYGPAFEYYAEGNALRHQQHGYKPDAALARIREVIRTFDTELISHAGHQDDSTAIFIVGMPRCGSTLVEQVLAAHPSVSSRGECSVFETQTLPDFATENQYGVTFEQATAFSPDQWQEVGARYMHYLREGDAQTPHITDKSLNNTRHIGAIHCALPRAKIIHVRRNPMDTCLSIFKNDLAGSEFHYGFHLKELGSYYLVYQELMTHWRDVLPAGAMYDIDYESLVANQEDETRKLLDYCGLDWDERCLKFNKAESLVRTASVAQVRKRMYSDSIEAWQRYEQHLQPLIRILGPEYSTNYRIGG